MKKISILSQSNIINNLKKEQSFPSAEGRSICAVKMIKKGPLLLDALLCKDVERSPVWLMRQAGRYLPEYRELRAKHSLFTLFHDPELASQVTLMPLNRYPLDAAIVFSDLLVLVEAFGKKAFYPDSGGLYLDSKVTSSSDLFILDKEALKEKLSYVFATLRIVKPLIEVPLLGFCGAPFTLLCYLLEGKGGSFETVRFWIKHSKEKFKEFLDVVCSVCISYARLQVEAGADAIQIFDSWTHILSKEEFLEFALPYWKRIKEELSDRKEPLIFFSRSNSLYPELISSIYPHAISFDEGSPLSFLRQAVPKGIAIQGNYSPQSLASKSPKEIFEEVRMMARSVEGERGVVFNLGHGVLPNTPLENVTAFLEGVGVTT